MITSKDDFNINEDYLNKMNTNTTTQHNSNFLIGNYFKYF